MAERLEKPSEGLPRSAQPEKVHKTPDPRPHHVELDALRGIGILGVVMAHAVTRWDSVIQKPSNVPLLNIQLSDLFLSLGGLGLILFFLISGYLLAGTEGRRASKGNYSLRSYALRRALRLIPAYYFALALTFLLWPEVPTLMDTLVHVTVLQGLVPVYAHYTAYDHAFWYLTSEVVFYAMLPLLVLKLRGLYPRLVLFGALVAAALTINVYLDAEYRLSSDGTYSTTFEYLHFFPLRHLWLFGVGVLLRMLVEHLKERNLGGSRPTVAFLLSVGPLVLLALFLCIPFIRGLLVSGSPLISQMVTESLVIPFFTAAVLGSPVLSRILSWRLLGFVGVISYSLFLLHNTVLMVARTQVLPLVKPLLKQLDGIALWLAFAGYLGSVLIVCGAVAYLSYRYIESPFLRYKPK